MNKLNAPFPAVHDEYLDHGAPATPQHGPSAGPVLERPILVGDAGIFT